MGSVRRAMSAVTWAVVASSDAPVRSAICAFVCPSITPARTCCSLSLRRGRSSSHAVSSCRPTCSRVSRSISDLPAPTLLMASVMSELRVSLTTYPASAREDRRGERLVVAGRGQQQATDRRIGGSHCSADFDPGPVLQPEVQHHDVDPEVRDDPGGFPRRPGVTDDVDVDRGDQQVPKPLPNDVVVVQQVDAQVLRDVAHHRPVVLLRRAHHHREVRGRSGQADRPAQHRSAENGGIEEDPQGQPWVEVEDLEGEAHDGCGCGYRDSPPGSEGNRQSGDDVQHRCDAGEPHRQPGVRRPAVPGSW